MKKPKNIDIQNTKADENMLRKKIEIGLTQSAKGQTKTTEQAKARLKNG